MSSCAPSSWPQRGLGMCDGSCGKKRRGPRSLNGRKQKLTGDKPSIVCVLETSGISEAAFPPATGTTCVWRVLGWDEAESQLFPLHLCARGWGARLLTGRQTPSGGSQRHRGRTPGQLGPAGGSLGTGPRPERQAGASCLYDPCKVCIKEAVTQSCLTLCDLMVCP